jgi:hypothetical protein
MLHERSTFTRVTAGPSPLLTDFYSTNYSFDYYRKYSATKPKKTDTSAYPKNVQSYVKYNPKLDETDMQFISGSRTTSLYSLDYERKKQHATPNPKGLLFKHLPHVFPDNFRRQLVQGLTTSSADQNASGREKNTRNVAKRMIMPSGSGFTADIDHQSGGNRADKDRFAVYFGKYLINRGNFQDHHENGMNTGSYRWALIPSLGAGNQSYLISARLTNHLSQHHSSLPKLRLERRKRPAVP